MQKTKKDEKEAAQAMITLTRTSADMNRIAEEQQQQQRARREGPRTFMIRLDLPESGAVVTFKIDAPASKMKKSVTADEQRGAELLLQSIANLYLQ